MGRDSGDFGRRLRALRKERGLSQERLAEKVFGDRSKAPTISRWETGKANPPDDATIIRAIARALEVDPLELLWPAWYDRLPEELKGIIEPMIPSGRGLPLWPPPGVLESFRIVQQAATALLARRIAYRLLEHTEEKVRLGQFLARYLPRKKIFLDSGTTLAICAEEIARKDRRFDIFTFNLLAAVHLLPTEGVISLTGGAISEYGSLVGEEVKVQIGEIFSKNKDMITIMGATALSWEDGPCARDEDHKSLREALMDNASNAGSLLLIIVDSSKLVEKAEPPHKPPSRLLWGRRREDPRTCIVTTLPTEPEKREDFWRALSPFQQKGASLLSLSQFQGFFRARLPNEACHLVVLDEDGEPISSPEGDPGERKAKSWEELKRRCGLMKDEPL
jgi:transcriptional regulator with XRE-family HTH domain